MCWKISKPSSGKRQSTPGFVTTSKALLDKNPKPTEGEIVEALGGNLCRCGTYPQHVKAILQAADKLNGGK